MPGLNLIFESRLLRMLVRFCIMALLFTAIEQLFALHRTQPVFRQGYKTDILHFFLSRLLVNFGFAFISAVLLSSVATSEWLKPIRSWIATLSLGIQLPLALSISLFFNYWDHRLAHTWKWRWRLHSIHHTTTEMDWLATARLHPLDQILHRSVSHLPIVLLNFSVVHTVAPVLALLALMAIFNHANVRITFPPVINRILTTPQYHHWHHAAKPHNKNFGAMSPIMDWIFGTYYLPKNRWPSEYGISTKISQNYWAHLTTPFGYQEVWRRKSN